MPPPPHWSCVSFAGVATLLAAYLCVYALATWGGKASTVASMVLMDRQSTWWQVSSTFFRFRSSLLESD